MTSPDLRRRIKATQARQGGFSAHILPSPVIYDPAAEFFEFRPRLVGGKWLLDGPTLGDGYELQEPSFGSLQLVGEFAEFSLPQTGSVAFAFLDSLVVIDGEIQLPLPDLSLPLGTGLTVDGWFTPPLNDGSITARWSQTEPETSISEAGISVSRGESGLLAGLRFQVPLQSPETILYAISDTSEPIHLRGVFSNGLVTLAVNGAQVASQSFNMTLLQSRFDRFSSFLSRPAGPAISAKVKLQRLYYTALRRDQFTPPTV
jgi:hypothetical protein